MSQDKGDNGGPVGTALALFILAAVLLKIFGTF
jgi:hypothetical protein